VSTEIPPVETPLATSDAASAAQRVFRGAYSLILNTALTAALGLAFWVVAARLYSPADVGRDSALISAMMALSAICGLNLQNVLLRFLPTWRRRPGRALLSAYALAALATTLGASVFILLMPKVSGEFGVLAERPEFAALYGAATAAWTVFFMQDAVLTALRRAAWVPVENAGYGVLKLAALFGMVAVGAKNGVFIAWVVPMMLLLVPVNYLIFRRLLPGHAAQRRTVAAAPPLMDRRSLRFVSLDSAGFALNYAALWLAPLLVIALLGSDANAYFYIPFTIVVTFDLLFLNVAASLVVEGAHDETAIPYLVRSAVRRFAPLLLLGVLVLVLGAPLILAAFSPEYAREGSDVLRLMALGSLFRGIMVLFIAIQRLRRLGGAILLIQSTFCGLLLGLMVLLADPLGINGVGLAWLIATGMGALLATPTVVRFLREGEPGRATNGDSLPHVPA
jgi:O-antigen/teichoic acid export membrane protein